MCSSLFFGCSCGIKYMQTRHSVSIVLAVAHFSLRFISHNVCLVHSETLARAHTHASRSKHQLNKIGRKKWEPSKILIFFLYSVLFLLLSSISTSLTLADFNSVLCRGSWMLLYRCICSNTLLRVTNWCLYTLHMNTYLRATYRIRIYYTSYDSGEYTYLEEPEEEEEGKKEKHSLSSVCQFIYNLYL